MRKELVIGTRGSKLALAQSEEMRRQLCARAGDERAVRLEVIQTTGDRSRDSLSEIGGRGLFTAELERALLDGRVDLAVHSLKDLPTDNPSGLELVATPPRADVRDVLVVRRDRMLSHEHALDSLPEGAVVGTGSARRRAQLQALRGDLKFADIRGNVDTRLRKVEMGEVDAIALAAAGLQRLGLLDRITGYLDTDLLLPAPGQGALGLQMRSGDDRLSLVSSLNHEPTWAAAVAERSFLHALGGGCQAPIAAWGREISGELLLDGLISSLDGSDVRRQGTAGAPDSAEALGDKLAREMLAAGAGPLLEAAGSPTSDGSAAPGR